MRRGHATPGSARVFDLENDSALCRLGSRRQRWRRVAEYKCAGEAVVRDRRKAVVFNQTTLYN